VPEELRSRIFHAYAQAASSETPVHDGTGLGLSITKKLVELNGGEIEMNSVIGQGSAFTFTIPLPSGTAEKAKRAARQAEPVPIGALPAGTDYPVYVKGSKEERLLVVNDDFANLQSMINQLRLEGYPAVVVNRGQMALYELAKSPDFFLVILDITMPDMSGYAKRGRERHADCLHHSCTSASGARGSAGPQISSEEEVT
jgi:hypothetical protein